MGFLSLIIGLAMIYIKLKYGGKLYDPKETMYQNSNKIGTWAFAILFIIIGILSIIRDISHYFIK
jgi:hypothetical protein